jgi:hypothetical protein
MENFDPGLGTFLLGGVVVGVLVNLWRRRNRPRTVVDERGERQYVRTWNRGQPVYDPKTWQQRIIEEAKLRRERRAILFMTGAATLGPIALAYYAYQTSSSLWGALAGLLLVTFTLPFGIGFFIPNLVKELTYLSGYQGMEGAKVLDRQPAAQPGREVVETQKAHGDARLAGEAEALSLLNPKK